MATEIARSTPNGFYAGVYKPWTGYDSPIDMESDESGAFSPRRIVNPAASDPNASVYMPELRDVSTRLNAALAAPHAGLARQVIGAFIGHRNPELGGLISGETQRQRAIEPLTQQYGLLSNIIQQNRATQMANLNATKTQADIDYMRQHGQYFDRMANAKEEPSTAFALWQQQNPGKPVQDFLQMQQEAKPTAPKKAGLTYDNGIPVSFTDENGATWDVNDPNLPATGKALVKTANAAHSQHVKEAADAQARAIAAAQQRQQQGFTRQDVAAHDKNYVQPAEQVEKSYQMMNNAYNEYKQAKAQGKELPTGAQSMLALSTHLSTTFGNVKGARVTRDMIREHLGARSISDDALTAIQKLTNGDVLSPDQWDAFHDLIGESRKLSWQTAVKEAKRKNIPVDFLPSDLQGVSEGGGKGDFFSQFGGQSRPQ